MGRIYQVPPDMKEKEKIIGGLLTLQQFYWILGGGGLGALLLISCYVLTKIGILAILLGVLGILSSMPFAFLKKHELPLFTYIRRKRQFKKKTKKLINMRKDV